MNQVAPQYNAEFFDAQVSGAYASAKVIIPLALSMLPPVKSVIDVGCGAGAWLAACRDAGVTDLKGLDGGEPAEASLMVPRETISVVDLTHPPDLQRRFDLVLSLEVAEHLPPEAAAGFIAYLTSLADVVLFSAAIPMQGGYHHVNEQPPSYWRAHFARCDFDLYDVVRGHIWRDRRVEPWYRQNTILAIRRGAAAGTNLTSVRDGDLIDVVHPDIFEHRARKRKNKLRRWVERLSL